MMQDYLYVVQQTRPIEQREFDRKLELRRLYDEGRRGEVGLGAQALLLLSDVLISLGEGLRERSARLTGESAESSLECAPGN